MDVNPNPDADGVHVRLSTRGFATAWLIANDLICPSDDVFDGKHCSNSHTSDGIPTAVGGRSPPAGGRARLIDTMIGAVYGRRWFDAGRVAPKKVVNAAPLSASGTGERSRHS